MPSPQGHTTTYNGNTIDGNAIAILGSVHGDLHFPDRAGDTEQQRCLRDLRVTDPREDRARIEGDKDKLLKDCYAWILDDSNFQQWRAQDASRLLWIKGDPGKGKTMMAMGVIAELSSARKERSWLETITATLNVGPGPSLLAYFFCQSTQPELNNALSVLRGLVYMLVTQSGDLLRYVQQPYKTVGKQLFEGPNAIYAMGGILSDVLNDASLPPTYLLVDALDECTSGLSELLRIITDTSLTRRSRVKWLVTSRNIPEIERQLQPDSRGIKVSLEVKASHVSKAVAAFVEYKVQRLVTVQRYDARLQAEVQQQLRSKAEGTFLWVSLVCKELEKVPFYRTREVLQALPPGLHPLYERMMAQIVTQDARTVGYCRGILRSVTLAFRPLQLEELAATVGLPRDKFSDVQAVVDLVSRCGSFLTVREDIISFVHLSAKDFFTLGNGRQVFDGTAAEEQGRITHRLLDAMDSTLRRDMCSLQKPGVRIQEAKSRVQGSCLPQMAYACEYWVGHLQAGRHACSDVVADEGKVHRFFQKHLLHWLEAMSLLQKMSEAILALQKLEATLNEEESATVSSVVHDALRFAMWSGSGIQEAPLQVYYGALVFAPERSIVRHQFEGEMPAGVQVKRGLDEDWGPLLQTLEGHTSYITSVAFSAAGDRLASASYDKTGHTREVSSVAFSAAGDRLASASRDKAVRVWDAKTGQPLQTFEDTDWIESVAFSNDGSCLEANRGTLLLSLPAQSTSTLISQPPIQRIFVVERWLTVDAEEIIWIPANYQPSCTAVYSRQIAFGYSSGRVLVLELS
ncbi:unnamed protein product [Alternaria alternata]